jgi:hypothetical protein
MGKAASQTETASLPIADFQTLWLLIGAGLEMDEKYLRLLRWQPCVIPKQTDNPRQRGRQRGLRVDQYSLGKWMTLLAKYSVISSSGKSVCSMFLVNTMFPLPSSQVSFSVNPVLPHSWCRLD